MKKRIQIIDFIRGIAVIVMIIANFSAYFINSPNTIFFRVVYSFAAPMFLFISGYSYFISSIGITNPFNKIKYGMFIIFAAVFIDLFIWRISPLCTFDVLHIIGFGFIFNGLTFKLNSIFRIFLTLLILLVPLIFRNEIIYRFQLNELDLTNIMELNWYNYINLNPFKRFLFDGWFPLFPWLGIILFGFVFAENKFKITQYIKTIYLLGILGLISGILLGINNISYSDRNGYLELFYPLNSYFLLATISLCTLIGLLISSWQSQLFGKYNFIIKLGKNSLFIYILHCLIIVLIVPKVDEINELFFGLFSLFTLIAIYFMLIFIDYFKSKFHLSKSS